MMSENHTVSQLKGKLTSLFSVNPVDMRLHFCGAVLEDSQSLRDAGFRKGACEASNPAVVGLSLRSSGTLYCSILIHHSPLSLIPRRSMGRAEYYAGKRSSAATGCSSKKSHGQHFDQIERTWHCINCLAEV
ncbi:hypothetical protein M514_05565, partial [Trichuris suis]